MENQKKRVDQKDSNVQNNLQSVEPKEILTLSLKDFHLGPVYCLKKTQIQKIVSVDPAEFRRSASSWFYTEFCKKVRAAWKNLRNLKLSQCSILGFQQLQFCLNFLCHGRDVDREEEQGSITAFWKANENEILKALDEIISKIEKGEKNDNDHENVVDEVDDSVDAELSAGDEFSSSRKKRGRQMSSSDSSGASFSCMSQSNKTIAHIFSAYQTEVKLRERAEEELRICRKKLDALERTLYPRAVFELDFDLSGCKSSSATQYGVELLNESGFRKLLAEATDGQRTGFKKDVEKFIAEFYKSYSSRIHNHVPRELTVKCDDYDNPAEVYGLCVLYRYFRQPFKYYGPEAKDPSQCPFLPRCNTNK